MALRERFRLIPFLSITVLTIVVCEATVRLTGFYPRYAVQMNGVPSDRAVLMIELDPRRLFRLLPDPKLGIDRRGYRNWSDSSSYFLNPPKIAVLGDSIVMGMAVEEGETMTRRLAKRLTPPVPVLSFGVQGYGPDQSLRVLEEDVLRLSPRNVVLVLYPENDFSDLMRNDLVTIDGSGEAIFRADNVVARLLPIVRLQLVWNLLASGHFLAPEVEAGIDELLFQDKGEVFRDSDSTEARTARAMLRGVLQRFKRRCSERQVPLLIAVVPGVRELRGYRAGKRGALANVEAAVAVVEEVGLPVIDLSGWRDRGDFEALYSLSDLHLSAAGHDEVAKTLASALDATVLREPPAS